jgi:hypothetical protein
MAKKTTKTTAKAAKKTTAKKTARTATKKTDPRARWQDRSVRSPLTTPAKKQAPVAAPAEPDWAARAIKIAAAREANAAAGITVRQQRAEAKARREGTTLPVWKTPATTAKRGKGKTAAPAPTRKGAKPAGPVTVPAKRAKAARKTPPAPVAPTEGDTSRA